MPNTIYLHLLNNRQIKPEMQGIPLATENGYRIIAGEQDATQFVIASNPTDYNSATWTVEMVNSQGYGIVETQLTNITVGSTTYKGFVLPVGMAVEGYAKILLRAYIGGEIIPFNLLLVKVWNTLPQWRENVSNDVMASESWVLSHSAGNASLSINSSTYVVTLQLKDGNGNNIGTPQTIVGVTNKGGTFTVLSSAWNNNSVTISISDLGANDKIDVSATTRAGLEAINEAGIFITASTGSITMTATETPSGNIDFQYFITKGVA